MKIEVDSINSITQNINGNEYAHLVIDVKMFDRQYELLFYNLWKEFGDEGLKFLIESENGGEGNSGYVFEKRLPK